MFGEVGRPLLDGLLLLMQAAVVVLWRGSARKNGVVGVVGGGVMEAVVVVIRSRAACVFLEACQLLPKPELPYESLAWRAQGPRHSGPLIRWPITYLQFTSYHSIRTSCYYNTLAPTQSSTSFWSLPSIVSLPRGIINVRR